jgi:hypothetical protein
VQQNQSFADATKVGNYGMPDSNTADVIQHGMDASIQAREKFGIP